MGQGARRVRHGQWAYKKKCQAASRDPQGPEKPKNPQTFLPVTEPRPSPERGLRTFWGFRSLNNRGDRRCCGFSQDSSRQEGFL